MSNLKVVTSIFVTPVQLNERTTIEILKELSTQIKSVIRISDRVLLCFSFLKSLLF